MPLALKCNREPSSGSGACRWTILLRMAVPVWIARGARPGKTLAVTAGIHGDELNGVEIARRIFAETDPNDLSGTLVVLPVLIGMAFWPAAAT